MLDVITDRRARLEQARVELTENESGLAALAEAKADASKAGREAFASWKDEYDWRTMEKERLSVLIETLQSELEREDTAEAEIALRERHNRQRATNSELAQRISEKLSQINREALALLREVAAAAMEDAEINAALPAGLEPLVSAHMLARARQGRAREEIGSKRLSLWVRSDNGAIIGDPDAVEDIGNGRGMIRRMAPLPAIRCHKALFEQISFHPAEPPVRPSPFWQIRLVDADGPGTIFDGTELTHPSHVLAALDGVARVSEPRDRPIETEIRPVTG
ncbi:hypothetical protein [Bradyrhizobium sp. 164]|uniref:hypothetical protein n=1 Tax=Bradyrhizobium sp. 164 TaxID=2782637 RepID=UPI001FFB44B9|nr:hypothetical protein [Bradyrhizobium sp. 164]MCK1595571.1 hypothetical protein [Bradyrhizobium sp. 164]